MTQSKQASVLETRFTMCYVNNFSYRSLLPFKNMRVSNNESDICARCGRMIHAFVEKYVPPEPRTVIGHLARKLANMRYMQFTVKIQSERLCVIILTRSIKVVTRPRRSWSVTSPGMGHWCTCPLEFANARKFCRPNARWLLLLDDFVTTNFGTRAPRARAP